MKPGRPLDFISDTFTVRTCASEEKVLLSEISNWDLLNLRVKDILDISSDLQQQYSISPTFLQNALEPYLIQTIGKDSLEKLYEIELPTQYLISATKHYSWPKGAG